MPETHRTHSTVSGPARAYILLVVSGLLAALAGAPIGCKAKAGGAPADAAASAPKLPPLVVRDDSTGLTFSYVTLDGGFQLVQRIADIPYEARDAIRVWSDQTGDGIAGPWVYVADVRGALPDGTYKVEVMPREAFDAIASARRSKVKGTPAKGSPPAAAGAPEGPPGETKGGVSVIIYGAEWCQPCHAAERYMKSKGIAFIHKDVDDPNVSEEMRDKLHAAGIRTGSIPILDVRGKLLVGFSPEELDRALADARR